MISVGNKHHGDVGIYVARPSPLGNPFIVGRDGDRGQLIAPYKKWLWKQIKDQNPEVLKELNWIKEEAKRGDVKLICFCHPKPCHADIIKSCVEWLIEKEPT